MGTVGRPDPDDSRSLDGHLETCDGCRADAAELAGVGRALSFLGSEQWERLIEDHEEVVVPLTATDPPRRRSRRLPVLVAAAAAVVVALVVSLVTLGGSPAPSTTVALVGQAGVRASVVLAPQGGGTAATLDVAGESAGQVLTLSMRSSSGSWWVAGSYRTAAGSGSQVVHLSCGLAPDRITGVWVTDQSGTVLLGGSVGLPEAGGGAIDTPPAAVYSN